MAEESSGKPSPADDKLGLGSEDVNSLLAAAQNSLSSVGAEIGLDPAGKADQPVAGSPEGLEKDSAKKVEQTLADLERDLSALNKETDDSPAPVEKQGDENAQNSNEDVDAILADLEGELGSLNTPAAPAKEKEPEAAPDADNDAAAEEKSQETPPAEEESGKETDIDDVLASLAEELTEDDAAGTEHKIQAAPVADTSLAAEDEQQVEEEITQKLSQQEADEDAAEDDADSEKAKETASPIEKEVVEAPSAPTKVVEGDKAENGDSEAGEDVDTKESAAAEPEDKSAAADTVENKDASTEKPSDDEPSAAESASTFERSSLSDEGDKKDSTDNDESEVSVKQDPYAHFPPAQQVLVRSLAACNQPFAFVSPQTRDTLGLIGIITVILAFLAAGISLLML